MSEHDEAIRRIEGGDAWSEGDEVVAIEVRAPLRKAVVVLLTADEWELLRREAKERGVGPSALVQSWVTERLHRGPHVTGSPPRLCVGCPARNQL